MPTAFLSTDAGMNLFRTLPRSYSYPIASYLPLASPPRCPTHTHTHDATPHRYGDRALVDALEAALALAVAVPTEHLMAFPKVRGVKLFFNSLNKCHDCFPRAQLLKLGKAHFALMEELFRSHLPLLASKDTATLMKLLEVRLTKHALLTYMRLKRNTASAVV